MGKKENKKKVAKKKVAKKKVARPKAEVPLQEPEPVVQPEPEPVAERVAEPILKSAATRCGCGGDLNIKQCPKCGRTWCDCCLKGNLYCPICETRGE